MVSASASAYFDYLLNYVAAFYFDAACKSRSIIPSSLGTNPPDALTFDDLLFPSSGGTPPAPPADDGGDIIPPSSAGMPPD